MDTCAAPAGSKPAAPSPWKEAGPEIEFHNPHAILIGLLLSPPIAMVGWLYIEALRWAFNAFAGVFTL